MARKKSTDHGALALDVCAEIAADKTATPAARVQAARTLAEASGIVGRHAEKPSAGRKDVADMTLDELNDAASGE